MKDSIRMYPNPPPWARTAWETQQPPNGQSILAPNSLQSQTHNTRWWRVRREHTASLCDGVRAEALKRPHDFNPRPSLQCALCFLFLCFLSFFLLAHLEQNHCISSGGAAVIPTQGLWRIGEHHAVLMLLLFLTKWTKLFSERWDLAFYTSPQFL